MRWTKVSPPRRPPCVPLWIKGRTERDRRCATHGPTAGDAPAPPCQPCPAGPALPGKERTGGGSRGRAPGPGCAPPAAVCGGYTGRAEFGERGRKAQAQTRREGKGEGRKRARGRGGGGGWKGGHAYISRTCRARIPGGREGGREGGMRRTRIPRIRGCWRKQRGTYSVETDRPRLTRRSLRRAHRAS